MAEWHTHYPVQSGTLYAQVVTTHTVASNGSATSIEVAARCETCGAVMQATDISDEATAMDAAKRLLADHASQCPGASEAA